MAYIIDTDELSRKLAKQTEILFQATTKNPDMVRRELESNRKKFPVRSDLVLYLARHLNLIIPYKAMCSGHCAPIEFLDHMMYCDGDVLAQACRSGGKTQQTGISCGMDAYPFDGRKGLQVRELGSCLPTGEYILTRNRGLVQIQEVQVGDLVMGRKGWNKVKKLTCQTYSGELIKIFPTGWTQGVRFTPEHRLWIARCDEKVYKSKHRSDVGLKHAIAEWIPAKDVNSFDMAVVPKCKPYVGSVRQIILKTKPPSKVQTLIVDPTTPEWGFIIGSYIAEGCCNSRNVIWTWGTSDRKIAAVDRLMQSLQEVGLTPHKHHKGNVIIVNVGSVGLVEYLKKACGHNAHDKKIPDEFMEIMNPALLQGMWMGDGCDSDRLTYTTVSDILAGQLLALLTESNIFASVTKQKSEIIWFKAEEKMVFSGEVWAVRISGKSMSKLDKILDITPNKKRVGTGKYSFALEKGDDYYIGIRKIEKEQYSGQVWNLEVENDPAYGVHSLLCHNSADQGRRVYEEFEAFLEAGYKDKVKGDILQIRTAFDGGSRVEMLMQSQKSVRGPHVPRLKLDEIEEFDEQIFNASLSIPKGYGNVKSMVSMSSTFHKPRGLMSKQMKNFNGKILIWCIFEIMERCDGKCSTCNLSSYCPGFDKMKGAVGYVPIREARQQRSRILDDEVYESEALCRRPRTAGSVYARFNANIHGATLSLNLMHPIFRSFDYGTDHPTVLQYWQIVPVEGRQQARCIDEMRWQGKAPSVIVSDMQTHERECGYIAGCFENTYIPTDAAGFRAEVENAGISTSYAEMSVHPGIGTVRNLLVPDSNGTLGFLIDKEKCIDTIAEMEGYFIRNGNIVKDLDDGPDAARYFCHSRPELRAAMKPVIAIATYDMTG